MSLPTTQAPELGPYTLYLMDSQLYPHGEIEETGAEGSKTTGLRTIKGQSQSQGAKVSLCDLNSWDLSYIPHTCSKSIKWADVDPVDLILRPAQVPRHSSRGTCRRGSSEPMFQSIPLESPEVPIPAGGHVVPASHGVKDCDYLGTTCPQLETPPLPKSQDISLPTGWPNRTALTPCYKGLEHRKPWRGGPCRYTSCHCLFIWRTRILHGGTTVNSLQ